MKMTSQVPAQSVHGLSPELGLHGIPTESLIEFEGGGSMLSRQVLGEMLAANEPGVLNLRTHQRRVRRDNKRGENSKKRCGRGINSGLIQEEERARLVCQAEYLGWRREPGQGDLAESREIFEKRHSTRSKRRRQFSSEGQELTCVGDHGGSIEETVVRSTSVRHAKSPKIRQRVSMKLYDHDHNPRVIRSVINNTVVTGLVGGILEAERSKEMDYLKHELRLAWHHATEQEDRILRSQTGSYHRELLGELQLDAYTAYRNEMQHLTPRSTDKCIDDDKFQFQVCTKQKLIGSPSCMRVPPPGRVCTALSQTASRSSGVNIPQIHSPSRYPRYNQVEVGSAYASQSSSQFKTSDPLKWHFSSLRPFSAGRAKVAWGISEPRQRFEEPSGLGSHDLTPSVHDQAWPVLFVVGSAKLTDRNPLRVFSLPHFDDDLLTCLERATCESREKILQMIDVLKRFDSAHLVESTKRLCYTQYCIARNGTRSPGMCQGQRKRAAGEGPRQAWVHNTEDNTGGESPATTFVIEDDKPVNISEAEASRALTSGFLTTVFGDSTIKAMLRVCGRFSKNESSYSDSLSQPGDVIEATNEEGGSFSYSTVQTVRGIGTMMDAEGISDVAQELLDDTSYHCQVDKPNEGGMKMTGKASISPLREDDVNVVPVKMCPAKSFVASDSNDTCKSSGDHKLIEGGVLITQLVKAVAAKFRVYSIAARLAEGTSTQFLQSVDPEVSQPPYIDRHVDVHNSRSSRRRPASADSDELGLPPLKIFSTSKARSKMALSASDGTARPGTSVSKNEGTNECGFITVRSTPRCLRPGYKRKVTTSMLRQELEASELTAARLSKVITRKAEEWKRESRSSSGDERPVIAAFNAGAFSLRTPAAVDLAGTRICDPKIAAAFRHIYLGIIRQSWRTWFTLLRRRRAIETAEVLTRLVGAAALFSGVLEPLVLRRKQVWMHRWSLLIRAERVLEAQAAAVELQRVVRGFLGRAHARTVKMSRAATSIQKITRGRSGRARAARRAKFLRELEAVQVIESKYRVFVWQKNAARFSKLKNIECAATILTATGRGFLYGRRFARRVREARKEQMSALMIQSLWRGVRARLEAEVLLEAKTWKEAAVRIQAVGRGRRARNMFRPMVTRERAAACLSRSWRCASARREIRRRRERLHLALAINPLVRGYLGKVRVRRLFAERYRHQQAIVQACLIAQRLFRGKQGRLKAGGEILRRLAAIELQRTARGCIARRMSSSLREEKQSELAAALVSAIVVQRLWRGFYTRRKLAKRAIHKLKFQAAFTVQCMFYRFRLYRIRRLRRLALASAAADGQDAGGDEGGITMRSQSGPQIPGEADKTGSSQRRRNDVQNDTGGNRLVHEDACDDDNIIEDGNEVGIHTVKVDTADELQNECLSNVRSDKLVVSGGDTPLPVYEDMGDIVLQAAAFHQVRSVEEPPPTPPAVETQPVLLSPTERGMVTKITEVEIPSPVQPVLEYYEAKRRYLEAQEEAYGASSTKIQCLFRRRAAGCRTEAVRAETAELRRVQAQRNQSAVKIQAGARTRSARKAIAQKRKALKEIDRRQKSAISVQCTVRCFLAKCSLLRLRAAEKARLEKLNSMATCIQARVRGGQTRAVWRKFFHSRALLERERQRAGASKIQSTWRSKLARTEFEKRKSTQDEALLAEQLERHLKGILRGTLEAERRAAYATRLQCWWRGILAIRAKLRMIRQQKDITPESDKMGKQIAASAIQASWRGLKARRHYNDNYGNLFRERERKKYCMECEGEYATRTCDTCLDKFCERCWFRMHSKGARRFHHWQPFLKFSYSLFAPEGNSNDSIPSSMQQGEYTSAAYYGYHPQWDGQADDWATTMAWQGQNDQTQEEAVGFAGDQSWQAESTDPNAYSGYGTIGAALTLASGSTPGSDGGEYRYDNPSGYEDQPGGFNSDGYGYEYAATAATIADQQDWSQDYQSKSWSTLEAGAESHAEPQSETYKRFAQQAPAAEYGGAATYDGASGWDKWSSDWGTVESGPGSISAGEASQASASPDAQSWIGAYSPGYEYDGATAFDQSPAYYNYNENASHSGEYTQEWASWPTRGGTNGTELHASSASTSSGTDTKAAGPVTTSESSSRGWSWSVNEYGQRVSRDWVEYWDESAQATYFYNTITGEASWTEPAPE